MTKFLPILLLAFLIGCASNRATYTTIATTDRAVTDSYKGYVDSVIRGETRTNAVPVVSSSFDAFKAVVRVTIDKAGGDTNAPISGDLTAAAANTLRAINQAKGVK